MKIGTKLICIAKVGLGKHWVDYKNNTVNGPKYKEIVTFDGPHEKYKGSLYLKEYKSKNGWNGKWFIPLIEDTKFNESIENLINPKEVEYA